MESESLKSHILSFMRKCPQSTDLNGIGGNRGGKRGSAALHFQTTAGARRIFTVRGRGAAACVTFLQDEGCAENTPTALLLL